MEALGEEVRARRSVRSWALKLAWLAVPLALAGEAGHHLLERLGQTIAHHLFHIMFGGAAVVAFVIYAALDIRRHGWPRFSWRIRDEAGPPEPAP